MRAGTEPQKHPALSIEIEHALVAALRPEARRRDVSVARLVYDLLGMIAADGLVTAVLDDDPPSPARRGPGRPRSTDSPTWLSVRLQQGQAMRRRAGYRGSTSSSPAHTVGLSFSGGRPPGGGGAYCA
jgi:hypothetical protein